MLSSLLIANRGEIACRIIRTARHMGIRTVAVYSDADAKALHVRMADEAVHIGPSPATESYLVGARILEAAKRTKADAIHPGYGFLSENAEFATAVQAAGLIWVGPNPDSIRAMGLKDAAKTLMQDAGVPVTPGYIGEDQTPERLAREADAIGYPVLIKAVAGGGGKGMRKVESADDFVDMLQSCRREASASFGNDQVLIEKWVTSPRHIEVQIFGDTHGNVVHLFERDCSLQRRHQKVIEEAPAPGMDAVTRDAICCAAIRAAKAVDYVGAGTIEFIADASDGLRADRIFFMEMNTRLQVEHAVTEQITGVDLVEWQLRIARGEPLPCVQSELTIQGHAIEARLYAEDPASGFLPSTGPLDHYQLPVDDIRVDSGVGQGAMISPFYDPMIAKMIAHADTRDAAIAQLKGALDKTAIWPVRSNVGFLYRALENETFLSGNMTTALIADAGETLIPPSEPGEAMLAQAARHVVEAHTSPGREALQGFRLNAPPRAVVALQAGSDPYDVTAADHVDKGMMISALSSGAVLVTQAGQSFAIGLARGEVGAAAGGGDGAILSPMPGKVIAVEVAAGDAVAAGQRLLVLEAMKMEHSLSAPFDGTVAELNVTEGTQVQVDAVLVRIDAAPTTE